MVLASTGKVEEAFAAFDRAAACRRMLGDHTHEAITRAVQAHLLYQSGIVDDRAAVLLEAALALPAKGTTTSSGDCSSASSRPALRARADGRSRPDIVGDPRGCPARRIVHLSARDGLRGDIAMARGEFATAMRRYAQELRRARAMPVNGLLVCSEIALALAGLGEDCVALELDAGVEANIDREGFRWVSETLGPRNDTDGQLMAAARARLGTGTTAEAQRRGREAWPR